MNIYIVGIGPGSEGDMTIDAIKAIENCDVIVGYKYYFQFIEKHVHEGTECIDTGMKKETERAKIAFDKAKEGHNVCVISSGDASIYGMAPLMHEMKANENMSGIDLVTIPGISAFQKAAALLGAPIGHDMCILSMSDLMTPWKLIEKRIKAAAIGDFVTIIYNPKSHERYWQLHRLVEIFRHERKLGTPVGYVKQAGRSGQCCKVTTLESFDPEEIDMFTIVIIGNSQSRINNGNMITPRGYFRETSNQDSKPGQAIMQESFCTIRNSLKNPNRPDWQLWPMLHAIHTSADFEMENLLITDENTCDILLKKIKEGSIKTIVTDVSMVASGIRKGALNRLGLEVVCFINDPKAKEMADKENITRAQACMRIAAEMYPNAIYAFGNAPTGLMELCQLIRKGKANPSGIIGAPVGFVHVEESKHALKTFRNIPKIIIEGRKGGSNLAATLINSLLTFDDAKLMKPGRDL